MEVAAHQNIQDLTICVNEAQLERVEHFKYLGVVTHQHLTWVDHVDKITKKISQRIGLLQRVKYLLPLETRQTLYMSLIAPLFDYADIIWGHKNNDTLMRNLQVLQNRAARLFWINQNLALRVMLSISSIGNPSPWVDGFTLLLQCINI